MRRYLRGWVWIVLFTAALIAAGCSTAPNQVPETGNDPAGQLPTAVPSPTFVPTSAPTEAPTEAPTPAVQSTEPVESASPVRYDIVNPDSKARYLVREQLANLTLPNDAVGETDQVSGAIVLLPDGSIDASASRVVVNMASLATDSSRRDNFVRNNVLETNQYPEAVFIPKRTEGLSMPLPESGEVNYQLIGDLTIRGETREVAWAVTGTVEGDRAVGRATTSFTFGEFNLTQPRVPMVLSIEDNIRLELDLILQRSGGPAASAGEETGQAEVDMPGFTCTSPAALTPALTEGPYYTPGAPERTTLWEEGVPGTRLLLTGYVLNTDCQPVPGALVDFWQADGAGVYDNGGFVLRGIQYTDENGRYRLETVIPGEYPGRTPHIHVKVQAPGGPLLISQVFFPDAAQNQSDRIFDPGLIVTYLDSTDGVRATFDFVIATQ